jgi:protein-S-isoprenylcysteine O-methyltransferase Ste14
MPEKDPNQRANPLLMVFIIGRVIIILLVWLGVFLAMFLGYFTVPIILIGALAVIYALADLGFYVAVNRQRKARDLRKSFLNSLRSTDQDSNESP